MHDFLIEKEEKLYWNHVEMPENIVLTKVRFIWIISVTEPQLYLTLSRYKHYNSVSCQQHKSSQQVKITDARYFFSLEN